MGREELSSATAEQTKKFTDLKEGLDVHDTEKNAIDQDDMKELEQQWVVLSEKLASTSEAVAVMIKDLRTKMAEFILGGWNTTDSSVSLANALLTEMDLFQKRIAELQQWAKRHVSWAYVISTTKDEQGPATTTLQGAVGNEKFLAGATVTVNKDVATVQTNVSRWWHEAQVQVTKNNVTGEKTAVAVVRWGNVNLLDRTRSQWVQGLRPENRTIPEQPNKTAEDIVIEKQLPPEEPNVTPEISRDQKSRPISPQANAG